MDQQLVGYVRALRLAGARVSTAEALDAARTVSLLGYADRATLKTSLSVVLAKTAEDKALHETVFDLYFDARPSASSNQELPNDDLQPAATSEEDLLRSDEEGQSAFVNLAGSRDEARLARAMEQAAKAAGVDDIRFSTQRPYFVRRMMEALGVGALEERLRGLYEAKTPEAEAEAAALVAARTTLQVRARETVNRRFDVYGRAQTENFLDDVMASRDLGDLGPGDSERMRLIVQRMAKRLAVRHARRRRAKRRGQLDFRRILRANAGWDGAPVKLAWKHKKRAKPKLVAVCDVSPSVARHVRFLLMFLHALQEEVADLRAFAFSNQIHDVSLLLKDQNFSAAMDQVLKTAGGGGTDYGEALAGLSENSESLLDRRSTILILGDGRSNYSDPRVDLFREFADRTKRILWLCPEPIQSWGSGDSCMLDYRPYCDAMIHCATAKDLEAALDQALLAYG